MDYFPRLAAVLTAFFALGSFSGCHKTLAARPAGQTQAVTAPCPDSIGEKGLLGKPSVFTTHGQVTTTVAGLIHYTVTSGYLPIFAKAAQGGAVRACLFFFAYTRDDHATDPAWPVTFLFNGGPGSPSDWIHLGGLGPQTLDFGAEGITPTSSALSEDRNTLLASSDLVFVDPINTGYSRPAQGVDAAQFNGLHPEAESIGDFIQAYVNRYSRAASPKYLLGESYAGMRIPVLGRYLDEKLNLKLAGVTFVSPWLDAIGDGNFDEGDSNDAANDLPYIDYLPEYATIAWYHHRLAADLQAKSLLEVFNDAEAFANGDYLQALAAGDEITAPVRASAVAGLARFTSLSPQIIDASDLRFDVDQFRNGLLQDQNRVIAYYDGRMAAALPKPASSDPFDAFDDFFAGAQRAYFLGTLGVQNPLEYQGNEWKSWPGANPDGDIEGGYLNVLDDINQLATRNPSLKISVASGLYDLVCPAAEVHFLVRHLKPAVAARMRIHYYPAGHPVYFGAAAHASFAADMAAFISAPAN